MQIPKTIVPHCCISLALLAVLLSADGIGAAPAPKENNTEGGVGVEPPLTPEERHGRMRFMVQAFEASQSLSKEQKEKLNGIVTNLEKPVKELKGELKEFIGKLPERPKKDVEALFGEFGEDPHADKSIDVTKLSSEGQTIHKKLEEIYHNFDISQLKQCEEIKEAEAKLSAEDREKLHYGPAIKDCKEELTHHWDHLMKVIMAESDEERLKALHLTGAEAEAPKLFMRLILFARTLPTKELKEQLTKILSNIEEPAAKVDENFKAFVEKLDDEKLKKTGLELLSSMQKLSGSAPVEEGSLSGTTLAAFKELKKVHSDDKLSQLQSCEQTKAIIEKLSAEDKAKLKIHETKDCKTRVEHHWALFTKLVTGNEA